MDAEATRLLQRTDLIDTNNIRCRWQDDVVSGECRFDCFDPVIDLSPVFEGVARDARLLGLMSVLLGERAHLFKDKLIFKPANAKGYSLHQDYIAWPSFPKSFTTLIVAIDPSDAASGGTEVFPGQHANGNLTPPDGNYHDLPEFLVAGTPGIVLELKAGDIAVFDGFMPHRSAANRSGRSRRLLYLSYNAERDGGEQREAHYTEFKAWLQAQYAKYGTAPTRSFARIRTMTTTHRDTRVPPPASGSFTFRSTSRTSRDRLRSTARCSGSSRRSRIRTTRSSRSKSRRLSCRWRPGRARKRRQSQSCRSARADIRRARRHPAAHGSGGGSDASAKTASRAAMRCRRSSGRTIPTTRCGRSTCSTKTSRNTAMPVG